MKIKELGFFIMFVMLYFGLFYFSIKKITNYIYEKYGFEVFEISLICCIFGWFFLTGLFLFMIG